MYFGHDRQLSRIYTLEFSGSDERYVGQTVNLVQRISSHMWRWDDTVAIGFIECAREELSSIERTMITQMQRTHVPRNKTFTNNPASNAEIVLIVDPEEQIEWLEGVAPAYPSDRRTVEAERRQRTQNKFDQLAAAERYPLREVATYVRQVVVWPSITGGTYWSMSAMPSAARAKHRHRLLTLNAHNVELLYAHVFVQRAEVAVRVNLAQGHVRDAPRGP